MFRQPGNKLMKLSRVHLILCLLITLAAAVFCWAQLTSLRVFVILRVLAVCLVLAAGGGLSLIAAVRLAAFGQLTEDIHQLRVLPADQASSPDNPDSMYATGGFSLSGKSNAPRQRRSQSARNNQRAEDYSSQPEMTNAYSNPPYPAAQMQQTDMIGRSGWIQSDAIYIQCPRCGSRMTPEFAVAHHGCPQCKTPYQP